MTLPQNRLPNRQGLLVILTMLACAHAVLAQERCLTPDDVQKMIARVNSNPQEKLNENLRNELLKLKEKSQERVNTDIRENRTSSEVVERMRAVRAENTVKLCKIL